MTEVNVDLAPWKPIPTPIPPEWVNLTQELANRAKGMPHAYVLKTVKYDACGVGDLLCSWGLPLSAVMAGYLMEYDKRHIKAAQLDGIEQVLKHIEAAGRYARDIEDENLAPLLNPPYEDLNALLIAMAIYYQSLKHLQQQGVMRPLNARILIRIERIGNVLLNIAKQLGMWYFKREIEDMTKHLLNPGIFEEDWKEYNRILQQDSYVLDEINDLLTTTYQKTTDQPIRVIYTPCGVAGLKRRMQDAHTTVTSQKTQLTGFDLVAFDVIVPTVRDCYRAFGILSQLGYIQDRLTDHIANPKNNGYSHIALGLLLNLRRYGLQTIAMPDGQTPVCQIQIATRLMQAIACYGCLFPGFSRRYEEQDQKYEKSRLLVGREFWESQEGHVFHVMQEPIAAPLSPTEAKERPITVYDKNRRAISLPLNATALDFAYALDNEIGTRAVDAIVNNRKAPLYRILQAGDSVEIRTARQTQVDNQWLDEDYANTPSAKRGIQEGINKRYRASRGYELLREELSRFRSSLTLENHLPLENLDEELRMLLKRFKLGSLPAFLEHLGNEQEKDYTPNWAAKEIMKHIEETDQRVSPRQGRIVWVPVIDPSMMFRKKGAYHQRLCGLCRPGYPKDEKILGRLGKRSGVLVVHKETCSHLIDRPLGRHSMLLPMVWQQQAPAIVVAFMVMVQDRKGLIFDVTRQLRNHECDLTEIKAEATNPKTGIGHLYFTIETHSEKEVLEVWNELYNIENVIEVKLDRRTTPTHLCDSLEKLRSQHATLSIKMTVEFAWEEQVNMLPPRPQALMNPFDISRPAGGNMFFGRSEEIKQMQRELCGEERGRALLMYGPRRSGKSSLCKNFIESHVYAPDWGVLCSLQNAPRQSEKAIFEHLADKVNATFQERFSQPAPRWEDFHESDPQLRFRRLLQECIARTDGARLILALDEFGGVIERNDRGALDMRFFTSWRELMQEIPQLSLIFAMPTSAHRVLNSHRFANVFSFAQPLSILFLDAESAKQLLADPLRDLHIAIHPNTVALAVTLTGGNPYYLTLIGQQLIQQLNQDFHKQLVSDKDLNFVVERLIEKETFQNFNYLLAEVQDDQELVVLEKMVDFMSRSNQLEVQLRKIASLIGTQMSTARRYLDRMRMGLILDENGPPSNPFYSFKIELVRRWLTHNRSFFTR